MGRHHYSTVKLPFWTPNLSKQSRLSLYVLAVWSHSHTARNTVCCWLVKSGVECLIERHRWTDVLRLSADLCQRSICDRPSNFPADKAAEIVLCEGIIQVSLVLSHQRVHRYFTMTSGCVVFNVLCICNYICMSYSQCHTCRMLSAALLFLK